MLTVIAFHAARRHLIMAPPKAKRAKKSAEAPEKTVWYLLVDHEGNLRFGHLHKLVVQADTDVADFKNWVKKEKPNELQLFDTNSFEVWTYKHKDFLNLTFEELEVIVGGIKFLKTSENLKSVSSSKQKMITIDLPEDVIVLVRLPPQITDTAGGGDGEYFIRLAPAQQTRCHRQDL
jgi:hypothetical protein